MELKKIGVISCAKVAGIIYAVFGLLAGGLVSLLAMAGAMQSAGGDGMTGGMIFGAGAIIIMPILYGGMGGIVAALSALLYNVVAGLVGGIELELRGPDGERFQSGHTH